MLALQFVAVAGQRRRERARRTAIAGARAFGQNGSGHEAPLSRARRARRTSPRRARADRAAALKRRRRPTGIRADRRARREMRARRSAPAAAALDEFGGAGRQQRQELRAGAVDLHVDVRFVEAEHPREHVELDPAARRRVVARLRIGEARARERHEAVVMRARAEIDRAAARVQRRRHVLLVAAHREIDALRQRRDLRRARQRGRHAAMREHQLPREFAADHRVAVMQHARGRRVVAEPVALRGAADGERGARQRVRAIERDRPRGRAQRPEHVDGLAQFARAPANRAGAAELDQIAVAQHHAFAFADESPGHERAVAAVIVQFPPPRRPADARVDARHVRIGDDRVATLRIATQYVARAQQAGFPERPFSNNAISSTRVKNARRPLAPQRTSCAFYVND